MSANKNNKNGLLRKLIAAVLVAFVAVAGIFLLADREPEAEELPETTGAAVSEGAAVTETAGEDGRSIQLNEGLFITGADNYTGIYMEDGSDEPVTGVLSIRLTNVSNEPVQYARITMDVEGEEALFTVTALPAGATAVLLEQNRMEYRADVDYMSLAAKCENLALFDRELTLHEDKLKIQTLDGALNITNVSGADISETIVLCYKGWQNEMYYGGIAYRIRLEGGLKAGELRQIMAEHFMEPGSKMVFVDLIQ